jgi:hypothetical protein
MTDDQIKYMTDRFLGWKLPENFNPDAGISFKATFNEHTPYPMKHEPTGTNLFDANQAEAMVRYMIDGLPSQASTPPTSGQIIMEVVSPGIVTDANGTRYVLEAASSMSWHYLFQKFAEYVEELDHATRSCWETDGEEANPDNCEKCYLGQLVEDFRKSSEAAPHWSEPIMAEVASAPSAQTKQFDIQSEDGTHEFIRMRPKKEAIPSAQTVEELWPIWLEGEAQKSRSDIIGGVKPPAAMRDFAEFVAASRTRALEQQLDGMTSERDQFEKLYEDAFGKLATAESDLKAALAAIRWVLRHAPRLS